MDRQDRRIDDVLNALRQAEPRPGLEDRVLARLRAADAANQTHAKLLHWPLAVQSRALAPWLAAATLLAVAGGTLLLHRTSRLIRRSMDDTHSVAAVTAGPRLKRETEDIPVAVARAPHVSERHAPRLVMSPQASAPRDEASDSLPPPPLPLTEQERLMLRLARREPPQQLAQLSKAAQDAALQHEKDSVTEFFTPPPPLEQDDSPTGQQ